MAEKLQLDLNGVSSKTYDLQAANDSAILVSHEVDFTLILAYNNVQMRTLWNIRCCLKQ